MARGGRPREFVEDAVLDRAAELFWERGYAATSLAEVSTATGLGRQSLYNAFGDKRGIFLSALDRYRDRVLARLLGPIEDPAAGVGELRSTLLRLARHQARGERRGCLLLNSAMELGPADAEVRERTQDHMRRLRQASQLIFERAIEAGELPAQDTRAAAESVVALTLGMHLMARAGASERAMGDAVDGALRGLAGATNGTSVQEV